MTAIAFEEARSLILPSNSYMDLFKIPPGDADGQRKYAKALYRTLLKVVHPDVVGSSDETRGLVEKLTKFYNQAVSAIDQNAVGLIPSAASFNSATMHHQTLYQLDDDCDMAQSYLTMTTIDGVDRPSFVKIARQVIDNELLANEASSIRRLHENGDPKRLMYYPELIDSFGASIAGKRLRVNVMNRLDGFYNLGQVRRVYADGVSTLHMAWIWRRVLWALDYAHKREVIHGAVLPQNIMILPAQHGVVLVDWCYSSRKLGTDYQPLKAIVGWQRAWYPSDVLDKKPVVRALDTSMGARSMVYIMGGNPVTGQLPTTVPRLMRDYFADIISSGNDATRRVSEAAVQFDELLVKLGAPYHPRTFQPFVM